MDGANETTLKKSIVKNLHCAIDKDLENNKQAAYLYYVESLRLVAEALKYDANQSSFFSESERRNLVEFAKQSVGRIALILNYQQPGSETTNADVFSRCTPSAPSAQAVAEDVNPDKISTFYPTINEELIMEENRSLVEKYNKKMISARSAVERQNLELELARQLVETEAINRKRLMQATAWAMQTAHEKFKLQDKLSSGTLKESDFRKQQLFALSLQYNDGNSWLKKLALDLDMNPSNEKLARDLLENIFSDALHPIKCTLVQMQKKCKQSLAQCMPLDGDVLVCKEQFAQVSTMVKEDLSVLFDVLTHLYDPLKFDKNHILTMELINGHYFSTIKTDVVNFLRIKCMADKENSVKAIMDNHQNFNCSMVEGNKEAIIQKLQYLTTLHSPCEMVDCAVHVIKMLVESNFDREHCTSVGADELLPKLCSVLASSGLPNLWAEVIYMECFMPSDRALGEGGYAVTVLNSAFHHLCSEHSS